MKRHEILLAAAFFFAGLVHAGGDSFFKEDERWLLTGDSITNTDTYRQAVKRILDHFHPENKIEFSNRAVWGVSSAHKTEVKDAPTMVTIMLGMNNVIHYEYPHQFDFTEKAEKYRQNILKHVEYYQNLGSDVVLFTPTLTDERVSSFFSPMYTKKGLELFGDVIRQIGKEKNCLVLPIAEELEAYDDTLGANQLARIDGVHPFGESQYRIAWSILHHLNAAGKLTGQRVMTPAPTPVPVEVKRKNFYLNEPSDKVTLTLKGKETVTVKLTWSLAGERGTQTLKIRKNQTVRWTLPASEKAYSIVVGDQKQAVVDLQTDDGKLSFYLIDLAKTRVVKPVNGELKFEIRTPKKPADGEPDFNSQHVYYSGTRPEGDLVGTFNIKEDGANLWFSGRVYDNKLDHNSYWITGRDNIRLLLDFRPGERFGNLTPDRDINMVLISPRAVPEFSLMTLAWWGPRYQYCMYANGKLNDDGYSWGYGYAGHITNYTPFDITKLDCYGFNVSIIDRDNKEFHLNSLMPTIYDNNVEKALNQLIIVDRKNLFPKDTTTTIQCFGM